MSPKAAERTAERLRTIGDPTRIGLLESLRGRGEGGVQELADELGLAHQNASHHLALLHRAGILERRRQGTSTIYAISDWSACWVIRQLSDWLEEPNSAGS